MKASVIWFYYLVVWAVFSIFMEQLSQEDKGLSKGGKVSVKNRQVAGKVAAIEGIYLYPYTYLLLSHQTLV